MSLFLAIHKVCLRKTAFIRTQFFSESALAALCGVALTVYSGGVSPTKLGGNVFKNMVKNTKSVINANTTKVFKGKVVMKNAKAVSKIRAGNIARAFGETAAISSGGWINSLGWRSVV